MGIYLGIIMICFGCSTFLFYRAAGTLNPGKANIITAFYYLFMLQTFIGIALITLGWDKHYTLDRLIERERSIQIGFIVIMAVSVIMPLVCIFFEKVCKINARKEYLLYLWKPAQVYNEELVYRVVCISSVFCIILLFIWFVQIGYIPALMLVHAPEDFNYAVERINIANSYLVHPYISNILILTCIPLLSYIAFSYMLVKADRKWYILFGILFMASILTKTYDFAKSPVVYYLAVFVLILIYNRGGVGWKLLGVFGMIAVVALVLMYRFTGYEGTLFDLYNGPVGRTLFSQLGALLCVFDAFPFCFNFLQGRSLSAPLLPILGMNPDMHLRSGKLMMAFYGSENVYDGSAGVLNSFFVGEAYANYGLEGIVFSVVWVMFLFTVIFIIVLKLKKTPMTIAFAAVMTVKMVLASQGGFFDFLFNVDLIFTCLVFLVGYILFDLRAKKYLQVFKKGSKE